MTSPDAGRVAVEVRRLLVPGVFPLRHVLVGVRGGRRPTLADPLSIEGGPDDG